MAVKVLDVEHIYLRNDTAANWTSVNPVLGKGEMGVENNTNKFKLGDGVKTWSQLPYAGVMVQASEQNGYIIIDGTEVKVYELPIATTSTLGGVKSQAAGTNNVVVGANGTMSVSEVTTAVQLKNARAFSISGDGTATSVNFNGTADVVLNLALATTGVTAGTYTKVKVDTKGRVTEGSTLVATDIPTLTLSKISDAGTAASKNVGASAGNVPILDSNGKLDESILPAIAVTDVFEVSSQAEMLALTAQKGDMAIRTDINKCFILKQTPASTLANWIELKTPTNAVLSVNGKTGTVVLTTSDIAEGSNLYFTDARATANFNTNFPTKSVTGLSDGEHVVLDTDTISIDCGNA